MLTSVSSMRSTLERAFAMQATPGELHRLASNRLVDATNAGCSVFLAHGSSEMPTSNVRTARAAPSPEREPAAGPGHVCYGSAPLPHATRHHWREPLEAAWQPIQVRDHVIRRYTADSQRSVIAAVTIEGNGDVSRCHLR